MGRQILFGNIVSINERKTGRFGHKLWDQCFGRTKDTQKEPRVGKILLKTEEISKTEAYRRIFVCENNVSVVCWAKLYRKELFEEIRYPLVKMNGDSGVIDRIIEKCNRIVYTPYAGYYYLRRKGSLIHGKMSDECWTAVGNARNLWHFIKEYYPDIEDAVKVFYYNNCIQIINIMVLDSDSSLQVF